MIDSLLKLFNIEHKYKRSAEVVPELSTYLTIKNSPNYQFGNFIDRYLKRIDVVDDFRFDGIACAQYIPPARKLRILVNPLNLWDRVLRVVALADEDISYSPEVQEIDRILVQAFKDNGWTQENFDIWIEFLNKFQLSTYRHLNIGSGKGNVAVPLSAILIHEFLHCAWCHCTSPRRHIDDDTELMYEKLPNVAMDFAINQTLTFGVLDPKFMTNKNENLLKAFISGGAPLRDDRQLDVHIGIFDSDFLNQPYEYYYNILRKADDELLKKVCGESKLRSTMFKLDPEDIFEMFKHQIGNLSPEELEKMKSDFGMGAGDGSSEFEDFNQTPTDIKKISNNDIKRIIDEMLRKGEIQDPSDALNQSPFDINNAFGNMIKGLYKTPTMPWDHILRHELIKIIGQSDFDYTMKRESRVINGMFPGKAREIGLDLVLIEDVSGSINQDDWNRFKNEMIRATREIDTPTVRYIQFHSKVSFDQMIPISKIRDVGIRETGGTSMKAPLEMLKKEGNTKTVIVFTDGWVDTGYNQDDFPFKIILFISASGNRSVCEGLANRGFTVISQDGDNEWYN